MLESYQDFNRHWCPHSERYTGCDSLLTAIDRGWKVYPLVTVHHHKLTQIYAFALYKGASIITMKVIETPMIHVMIRQKHIRVIDPQVTETLAEHRPLAAVL